MVKSPSLPRKESKPTQRIVSGILLIIFPFLLAVFPGLYITGAEPSWRALDQKPTLVFIRQRLPRETAAYRFYPQKREEKSPFLSPTIKGRKTGFEKFALGEKKFESKTSSFPISKNHFICENFSFGFTPHTEPSCQVAHFNFWVEPRAPPSIL